MWDCHRKVNGHYFHNKRLKVRGAVVISCHFLKRAFIIRHPLRYIIAKRIANKHEACVFQKEMRAHHGDKKGLMADDYGCVRRCGPLPMYLSTIDFEKISTCNI